MKLTPYLKRFLGLPVLTIGLFAAVPTTTADISGNGTVTQLVSSTATITTVHWVEIIAPITNSTSSCSISALSGCPRVGDSSISTTRGIALPPGSSMFYPESPANGGPSAGYNLKDVWYLIQTGDKLIITWGQ